MSMEYYNHLIKEMEVAKDFTSYFLCGDMVLFEGDPINAWECKDHETAENLLNHLRELEQKKTNLGMLSTTSQLGQLTDDEYHRIRRIINKK